MINIIYSRINYTYSKIIEHFGNVLPEEKIRILPASINESEPAQSSFDLNYNFYNEFKNKLLNGHTPQFPNQPLQRVARWKNIVDKASKAFGVSSNILYGIIHQESSGNASARAGTTTATGLMQLVEGTARDLGLTVNSRVDERLDPEKNIYAGARYISNLIKKYNGDVSMAVAAYHQGEGGMGRVRGMLSRGDASGAADTLGQEGLEYLPRVLTLVSAYKGF